MKRTIYAFVLSAVALAFAACGDKNNPNNPNANQGALKGKFSVSQYEMVYFSQGNLQYNRSLKEWRFAINQWDFVGDSRVGTVSENGEPCNNGYISQPSYQGWVDLFGWGTGNNPLLYSDKDADYAKFAEWGLNSISNGGEAMGQWHTLKKADWEYIISGRPYADELWACASVNGVHGLILLPDTWMDMDRIEFTPKATEWNTNQYDKNQWTKMELNGAVFLPAAGKRSIEKVESLKTDGFYWTSDEIPATFCFSEKNKGTSTTTDYAPHLAFSVRLVKTVPINN